MSDIEMGDEAGVFQLDSWWHATSNPFWVKALEGVSVQIKAKDLGDSAWTPAEETGILLVAILMTEALQAPSLKIEHGDFCTSFRYSLAAPADAFAYDLYESAAKNCIEQHGCSVPDLVLVVVTARFKLHADKSWPLATRFQNGGSKFCFVGKRLALLEESIKIAAYWILLFVDKFHGVEYEAVRKLMREQWFGSRMPVQTLEVRARPVAPGATLQDSPPCLLLAGVANLFANASDFDYYTKVLRALGFECDDEQRLKDAFGGFPPPGRAGAVPEEQGGDDPAAGFAAIVEMLCNGLKRSI